jgi:hypothetical protein
VPKAWLNIVYWYLDLELRIRFRVYVQQLCAILCVFLYLGFFPRFVFFLWIRKNRRWGSCSCTKLKVLVINGFSTSVPSRRISFKCVVCLLLCYSIGTVKVCVEWILKSWVCHLPNLSIFIHLKIKLFPDWVEHNGIDYSFSTFHFVAVWISFRKLGFFIAYTAMTPRFLILN